MSQRQRTAPGGRARKRALGKRVGSTLGGAFDAAFGTVGKILSSPLRLPGMPHARQHVTPDTPGARPGIDHLPDLDTPPPPDAVHIRCIDYGPDLIESTTVDDLDAFLTAPRPPGARVRWINVDGLHPYVVNRFRQTMGIHTLAAEDVLHVPQRPKAEAFDRHLFVVTRMTRLTDDGTRSEQVSLFVTPDTVLTFQEQAGDVWQPIRERLATEGSRLRQNDGSYLMYALIDAIVDHHFPLLERLGDGLESMEDAVITNPTPQLLRQIHAVKRELAAMRRVMWPMRELVAALMREDTPMIAPMTRTYLRDVYEHCIQLVDLIETYREMAGSLTDLHLSAASNRMNEVMKVLTIMATIFIPITFFAGVYGMNFEHIPELDWRFAYPLFWVICVATVVGLLWFFHRRGWIGRP